MKKPSLTIEEVKALPTPCRPEDFAKLSGMNLRTVQRLCGTGEIPARKFCGRWYINTARALELLGLNEPAGM